MGSSGSGPFHARAPDEANGFALFDVRTHGDEAYVYLQQGTPLIDLLNQEVMQNDEELQRTFELLVGALAYAEHLDCTINPDASDMWSDIREDISRSAHDFLKLHIAQFLNQRG